MYLPLRGGRSLRTNKNNHAEVERVSPGVWKRGVLTVSFPPRPTGSACLRHHGTLSRTLVFVTKTKRRRTKTRHARTLPRSTPLVSAWVLSFSRRKVPYGVDFPGRLEGSSDPGGGDARLNLLTPKGDGGFARSLLAFIHFSYRNKEGAESPRPFSLVLFSSSALRRIAERRRVFQWQITILGGGSLGSCVDEERS